MRGLNGKVTIVTGPGSTNASGASASSAPTAGKKAAPCGGWWVVGRRGGGHVEKGDAQCDACAASARRRGTCPGRSSSSTAPPRCANASGVGYLVQRSQTPDFASSATFLASSPELDDDLVGALGEAGQIGDLDAHAEKIGLAQRGGLRLGGLDGIAEGGEGLEEGAAGRGHDGLRVAGEGWGRTPAPLRPRPGEVGRGGGEAARGRVA